MVENLDIREHFRDADAYALKVVAKGVSREGVVFIEVGSYKGFSASILGELAKKYHGHLYCVDNWLGNEGDTFNPQVLFRLFRRNIEALGLTDYVHPLVMDSAQAVKIFANEYADLVFLDANHRYDYVKHDIQNWWLKIRPGGVLCGHDCEKHYTDYPPVAKRLIDKSLDIDYNCHIPCHPGVARALHEQFNRDFYIAEGTTVWFKNKDVV